MNEVKNLLKALKERNKTELKSEKVELGINDELNKLIAVANKIESEGKKLYQNINKAENLAKQAYKLLQPLGNFYETQVEQGLKELESAGLKNSNAYRELSSSWDYASRANYTTKRMAREISKAIQ